MRKILLAIAFITALALPVTAAEEITPMAGGSRLTFTTGGAQGTYYGFGSVLAGKITETTKDNKALFEPYGFSVYNIYLQRKN